MNFPWNDVNNVAVVVTYPECDMPGPLLASRS